MPTLGQIGFDAYGDHAEWKAYDGRPMPRWDDKLRTDIKEKWEVAAKAIAKEAIQKIVNEAKTAEDAGDFTQWVIGLEDE